MTKHKWHDVLIAIAEGNEVEYKHEGGEWVLAIISQVTPLTHSRFEWRIKKEPVIEVVYYFQQFNFDDYHAFDCEPKLKKWDLKITYQDGKAVKVELPE